MVLITEDLLGRYEYRGLTTKGNPSNKFWHVIFDKRSQSFYVKWGSIINPRQGGEKLNYTEQKLLSVIKGKIKKGYKKVDGYETVVGSNTEAFLLEDW
jgi:hypothetical protein